VKVEGEPVATLLRSLLRIAVDGMKRRASEERAALKQSADQYDADTEAYWHFINEYTDITIPEKESA
jgi:hypothetical protein